MLGVAATHTGALNYYTTWTARGQIAWADVLGSTDEMEDTVVIRNAVPAWNQVICEQVTVV